MFESNLPIDKQSFNYDSVLNVVQVIVRRLRQCDERSSLFSGSTTRVYIDSDAENENRPRTNVPANPQWRLQDFIL